MKRILSAILALFMTVCLLGGCKLDQESAPNVEQKPEINNPYLVYTLNQDMIDLFYDLLEETETLSIAAEDLDKTDEVSDQLEDAYMALIDQYQISYVLYCLDQSDEEIKTQYMDCLDLVTEAESEYNEMCKRVWLSETPFREYLFADWTEDEIERMLAYNDEIAQLEKRNAEITVEFRELEDITSDMIPLYNEMVENNNRIAQIYGYENYYDYAYEVVYQRDYEITEIEKMRQYVAQYLVDANLAAADSFAEVYDSLKSADSRFISHYVYEDYDSLEENYVMDYIGDMPDSAGENMQGMFDDERVVMTDYQNAYPGAFTTWIQEKPFCFFGPGYTNSETIIHELGHYYGSGFVESWSQPMDLAETQSQGNEWLFIQYLESRLEEDVYRCIAEYKLLSDIGYIICFVMIDEFEQQVYSHENAGDLTEEEYDAIMEGVAEQYGGIDFVSENILDIQAYWRQVVLESPVYYISYAVSGIAAINLFTIAQEDEAEARACYLRLQEEPLEEEGFLANIQHAGLTGPFEETVYMEICERYEN